MSRDRLPAEELFAENKEGRDQPGGEVSRRSFLRLGALAGGALAGAGAALAGPATESAAEDARAAAAKAVDEAPGRQIEETTIAELQAAMQAGELTALEIVDLYLGRIEALDQGGPGVNSVLELNPAARWIAFNRDGERADGHVRGPLHGIPILLKDNIDTHDQMQTTAGSFALVGTPPLQDSTVAQRLRAAGAVILGKANLSEWANFRGFKSSSGWSGRGDLTHNPYFIDRNACGSSSGSAAAVSAAFSAAALGTETDGSIVCPSSINGVVGIKPTVGLTSRAGVIPISHTQDTVGPHGRTVADAAAVLGALTGVDPRDPATAASQGHFSTDYTQFLDPDGLAGARIGVVRSGGFFGYSPETDSVAEEAIAAMVDAGATVIDVNIPTHDALNADPAEIIVLIWEFKRDLNAYLASRTGVPVHTLAETIQFNIDHADEELRFFGQEFFEFAEIEIFSEREYREALKRGKRLAGRQGIDAVLQRFDLDALFAPTGSPAWTSDLVNGDHFLGASSGPCAVAGYPIINVPGGYRFGLPVGVSFMGTAFSEPTLIKLASGFEHVVAARQTPNYLPSVPERSLTNFRAGGPKAAAEAFLAATKPRGYRVFGL